VEYLVSRLGAGEATQQIRVVLVDDVSASADQPNQ
jgi:hypothetical protein